MRRKIDKKGIAMLLVAILIVVAVPVAIIMVNLSSTQKKQAIHFNARLNVDQISLSGINKGYNYLKNPHFRPNKFKKYSADLSGNDRFDLSVSPTGKGFFNQDMYMMVSKSNRGELNSIIMADAEQFQIEADNPNTAMVITHDYWSTPMVLEINEASDVLTVKNFRGKDQMRALDVKKFEMDASQSEFQTAMNKLSNKLPKEVKSCWDTVVKNMVSDKIRGVDSEYTPPSTSTSASASTPGSGSNNTSNPGSNTGNNSDSPSWKPSENPNTDDNGNGQRPIGDPDNPTGWDEGDPGADTSEEIYRRYNQTR